MPSEEKHEGLVLRNTEFRDRQKILTLFTKKTGIISLIIKGISQKRSSLVTLASPLTCGEYLLRISRSSLYTFQDGTLIKTHSKLRENLDHIEAAALLVRALLKSQLPEKPAPNLYALTLTYLKFLPSIENPSTFSSSFLLKLLKHEGILSLDHPHTDFSSNQWQAVRILTELKTFQELQKTPTSPKLLEKVKTLFNNYYKDFSNSF